MACPYLLSSMMLTQVVVLNIVVTCLVTESVSVCYFAVVGSPLPRNPGAKLCAYPMCSTHLYGIDGPLIGKAFRWLLCAATTLVNVLA